MVSQEYARHGPTTSLNGAIIAEALAQSNDNGVTLKLCKLNLTDIGALAAEELATIGREAPEDESIVRRIAFTNNKLTTLPTEFALLSRLRYLNLSRNRFAIFPDVLTLLPALDTLDISYNRIKRLPSQPGKLVQLQVLCLTRNKLTRLPTYLPQFENLKDLRVDQNPLDLPIPAPTSVGSDSQNARADWTRSILKWLESEDRLRSINDSGYSEGNLSNNNLDPGYSTWRFPRQEFASSLPHSRSQSVDSSLSISSRVESPRPRQTKLSLDDDRPPPLHLGILSSYSDDASPTKSISSYLPSPADSTIFNDVHNAPSPKIEYDSPPHTRHPSELDVGRTTIGATKKSTPISRTPEHAFGRGTANGSGRSRFPDEVPVAQRQDSGSSLGSLSRFPLSNPDAHMHHPPSMTLERNSYFRRVSALPPNTLPNYLVSLVESARTILFAICQVHQTLEHYIACPIDDRLPFVLKRALDPASAEMLQLISALDRFDSMSRKSMPSAAICRAVVESCRNTVNAFNRAIGVLTLQLKVITSCDDVRYSRRLSLELYAATAEISCAWQSLGTHVESIRNMLHNKHFPAPSPAFTNGVHEINSSSSNTLSDLPLPIPRTTKPTGLGVTAINGRNRIARRHAGSFSSKDVEIGRTLPSYDGPLSLMSGVAPGSTPPMSFLRTPKRQATAPAASSVATVSAFPAGSQPGVSPLGLHPSASSTSLVTSKTSHSREGSATSLKTSSSSSSPSFAHKQGFLEPPLASSKAQLDQDALQAVMKAVKVAPAVWSMMEELSEHPELRENLEKAKAITEKLGETIRLIQETNSSVEKKTLRDDARIFLRIVVQLSNFIKQGNHAVSSALRSNMVKLTNSTEEFAIFLHVSSYAPTATRPYSPMLPSPFPATSEDNRLTSSLSRSRSVQPLSSTRIPPALDVPRTALPTQGFHLKYPSMQRTRENGTHVNNPDPG
ncbi:hypothetical protein AX16_003750 [Volvariella volvacea WC 439]|nr:hypothetical protein AX16_003750 [Volvariella volvacea WC 439]